MAVKSPTFIQPNANNVLGGIPPFTLPTGGGGITGTGIATFIPIWVSAGVVGNSPMSYTANNDLFSLGLTSSLSLNNNLYLNKFKPVVSLFATLPAGSGGQGITIDPQGNTYVVNFTSNTISKISPAGVVSLFATLPENSNPADIEIDPQGNLYVTNVTPNTIWKITPSGVASLFVTLATGSNPEGIVIDPNGNFYVVNNGFSTISKITPAGVVSLFATLPANNTSTFIIIDSLGNLYVTNSTPKTISKITPAGVVSTFVTLPTASGLRGIIMDNFSNFYVASIGNDLVLKITPSGVITTFATLSAGSVPVGITIDPQGSIYTVNNGLNNVSKITQPYYNKFLNVDSTGQIILQDFPSISGSSLSVNGTTVSTPNFQNNPLSLGTDLTVTGNNITGRVRDTDVSAIADREADIEIARLIGSSTTRGQISNGESINTVIINQVVGNPVQMTIYTVTNSNAILNTLNSLGANATTISPSSQGGNTLLVQSYSALVFQIVATFPATTTIAQVQALFGGLRSDSVFFGGARTGLGFNFQNPPQTEILRLAGTVAGNISVNNVPIPNANLKDATTDATTVGVKLIATGSDVKMTINKSEIPPTPIPPTTNTLSSATNTMTSVVNNVSSNAPIVNSNNITFDIPTKTLTSTVNGVSSSAIINITGGGGNINDSEVTLYSTLTPKPNAPVLGTDFLLSTDGKVITYKTFTSISQDAIFDMGNGVWLGFNSAFNILRRSVDNGLTWTQVYTTATTTTYPNAIRKPAIGIYPETIFVSLGKSMIRSVDNGLNWTLLTIAGFTTDTIQNLLYIPSATSSIMIFSNLGSYKSIDNGTTWVKKSSINFNSAILGNNNLIIGFTELTGVKISNDFGETFVATNISIGSFRNGVFASTMYVATTNGGIYTSPTGSVWTSINPVGNFRNIAFQNGNLYSFNIVDSNIYISRDMGITWTILFPFSGGISSGNSFSRNATTLFLDNSLAATTTLFYMADTTLSGNWQSSPLLAIYKATVRFTNIGVGTYSLIVSTVFEYSPTTIKDYVRDNFFAYDQDIDMGTSDGFNTYFGSRGQRTLGSGAFVTNTDNIITPTVPVFPSIENTVGGGIYTNSAGVNQMWFWKSNGANASTLYTNATANSNTFSPSNTGLANLLSAGINGNRTIQIGGSGGTYTTVIGFVAAIYTQTTTFTSGGRVFSMFNDGSYVAISADGLKMAVVGQRMVPDPIPVYVLQIYDISYPATGTTATITFSREFVLGTGNFPNFLDAITFGTTASNLVFGVDNGGDLWSFNHSTGVATLIKNNFIDDQFTGTGYTFANSNNGWILFGGDDGLSNVYNQNTNSFPYEAGIPIGLITQIYAVGISSTGEVTLIGNNTARTITYRQNPSFLEQNKLLAPLEIGGQQIRINNDAGTDGLAVIKKNGNPAWGTPDYISKLKKWKLNLSQGGNTALTFNPTPIIDMGSLPVTVTGALLDTFLFSEAGIYEIKFAYNVSADPDFWATLSGDTSRYLQLSGGQIKGSVEDVITISTANSTMTFKPNNNVTFFGNVGTSTYLSIKKI